MPRGASRRPAPSLRRSGAGRRCARIVLAVAVLGAAPGLAQAQQQQVTYRCASGTEVVATYGLADGGARLALKGRSFELYAVGDRAARRYASEQGLAPDRGLQWWAAGEEATLREMVMDHTAPGPRVIDTCRVQKR